MQHEHINIGEVTLHIVQAGPADGPPLILLHGFPEYWYGWRKQIEPLAEAGFRVIVPDQRGVNLSDKPRHIKQYDIDLLAGDVVKLAQALGHERFYLAGHDWGAAVGWHTAYRYPQHVEKLAVLNVPHPHAAQQFIMSSPKQTLKSWYIFWFQLPLLPELSLRWNGKQMMRATSKPSTFSQEDFQAYQVAWGQVGAARGAINWYRAMARRVLRRAKPTGKITAPVLIVWGLNDAALTFETAQASLAYCNSAELITLEEATHWVQHDEPERVNEALITFFGH